MSMTENRRAEAPGAPVDADAPAPGAIPSADAPLRRWIRRAVVGDVVTAGVAVYLAAALRFGGTSPTRMTLPYTLLTIGVILGWPALGAFCGTYELRPSLFGVEELRRILRSGLYLAASLGMVHFAFKLSLSRLFVVLLIPLVVGLTALWRLVLRKRTSNWLSAGTYHHRAVAVGAAGEIAELRAQLRARARGAAPIELVAFVADDLEDDDPAPAALSALRRLPNRDAIADLVAEGQKIDLLVRVGSPQPDEIARVTERAHAIGAWVALAPGRQNTTANLSYSYLPLGSTPLLVVETPALRPAAAFFKAVMDRVLAVVFLIVGSPLLLGISAAIALREGRPVLYRQTRVGHGGELFSCLKFRTMRCGADEELPSLLDSNEHDGPLFKIRNDPRITPTGRWLRKHSLDELPQLVNVLKGDMSLVGPRPALPSEVETFDVRARRRLLVKPGLTGLWQVEGRADLPWDEGVFLDLLYVDHWSPLLDGVILARTLKTIARPAGAY